MPNSISRLSPCSWDKNMDKYTIPDFYTPIRKSSESESLEKHREEFRKKLDDDLKNHFGSMVGCFNDDDLPTINFDDPNIPAQKVLKDTSTIQSDDELVSFDPDEQYVDDYRPTYTAYDYIIMGAGLAGLIMHFLKLI